MLIRRWRAHPLATAAAAASAFRVAVFLFALVWPIAGEDGRLVSPRLFEQGLDMGYYETSRNILFHGMYHGAVERYLHFYGLSDAPRPEDEGTMIVSAPLFPTLLEIFAYSRSNTLPIAFAYLLAGIALAVLWLRWLHRRGVGPTWLLVFALLPNPVWIALGISTDLLFALAFALFFVAYDRIDGGEGGVRSRELWVAVACACAAALTRGNGPLLLVFFVLDRVRRRSWMRAGERGPMAFSVVAIGVAGLYYLPEFVAFSGLGDPSHRFDLVYFGMRDDDYVAGLFAFLPDVLDTLASILVLGGAKILYFVGLRPSYWDIPTVFLLARSAAGFVLLPGLAYALARGENSHRLLIVLYLVPILIGASLDRYNFAILPLLFYYGVQAYYAVGRKVGLLSSA